MGRRRRQQSSAAVADPLADAAHEPAGHGAHGAAPAARPWRGRWLMAPACAGPCVSGVRPDGLCGVGARANRSRSAAACPTQRYSRWSARRLTCGTARSCGSSPSSSSRPCSTRQRYACQRARRRCPPLANTSRRADPPPLARHPHVPAGPACARGLAWPASAHGPPPRTRQLLAHGDDRQSGRVGHGASMDGARVGGGGGSWRPKSGAIVLTCWRHGAPIPPRATAARRFKC